MKRNFRIFSLLSLSIVYFSLYSVFVIAQDDDEDAFQMTSMNPIGREEITPRLKPLGFGLMGDQIDTDKGAVVFSAVDVSLKGNSDLEVAIRRTTGSWEYTNRQDHYMADWILEVPSISGFMRAGKNWANNRCSNSSAVIGTSNGVDDSNGTDDYLQDSWYDSLKLNIPGQGSKILLENRTISGVAEFSKARWSPFVWRNITSGKGATDITRVTTDYWVVGCTSSSISTAGVVDSDGPGEGFVATAPNGDKYTFNRLHYFPAAYHQPMFWSYGKTHDYSYLVRNMATMLATKVEDVNGNWVKYDYDASGRLTRIHSNDNRELIVEYVSGSNLIASVEAVNAGSVWTYSYKDFTENIRNKGSRTVKLLDRVTLPDGNYWEYNLGKLTRNKASASYNYNEQHTVTIKHPHGAIASYEVVDGHSEKISGSWLYDWAANYPDKALYRKVKTVKSKTISGSSIPTSTWSYSGPFFPDNTVGSDRRLTVTDPKGTVTRYTYEDIVQPSSGIGKTRVLKSVESFSNQGVLIEKVDNTYIQEPMFGYIPHTSYEYEDNIQTAPARLLKSIKQRDGDTFSTEYTYNIDPASAAYSYGKPLSTSRYSNVSSAKRTSLYTYEHNKNRWILGLPKSVVTNGRQEAAFSYDSYGRKTELYNYGVKQADIAYFSSGNHLGKPKSFTDAIGRTTSVWMWVYGVPIKITRADGSYDWVSLGDAGLISEMSDLNGVVTDYSYDRMGRLTRKGYYEGGWADEHFQYSFSQAGVTQRLWGSGKFETLITYDNYLRVIEEKTTDLVENKTTYVRTEYNASGEEVFKSFPSENPNELNGTVKSYDALGRLSAEMENVYPYATINYGYGSQHTKTVTDASGNTTTYSYDGYAGPDKGELLKIVQPLGVTTVFTRNIWGQLTALNQSGSHNGYAVSGTQYFYYNAQQNLCRHSTPEAGHTLYQYDAVGNIISYQRGAASGTACTTPSGIGKVTLTYDAIDRLVFTDFADSATGDISKTYDPNGNVLSVRRAGVDWVYTYNEKNLLNSESLSLDGRTYNLGYTYDRNARLVSRTLPSGRVLAYAHDGVGRPTSATNNGQSLIQDINYFANDSVQSMYYANNQVLTQVLNDRLQVARSYTQQGTNKIVDFNYSYDTRGDITAISDGVTTSNSRNYSYDALGRLLTASGPWGTGSYVYDALGNLRNKNLGNRSVAVSYSSANNRATYNTDSAATARSIGYDSRGNVTQLGTIGFVYDYADQPVQATGAMTGSYRYDGNMRRVKAVANGKSIYNVFDASGHLVYVDAVSDGVATEYLDVSGKSVARVTGGTLTYLHYDHLGSPIAGSSTTGAKLWFEQYTPYGEKLIDNVSNRNLASFTGHIYDEASRLTYMQARYYDPILGRFLSIDPIEFKQSNPMSFNRYAYANNNPYRYIDPDGEYIVPIAIAALAGLAAWIGVDWSEQGATDIMSGKEKQIEDAENGRSTDAGREQIEQGAAKLNGAALTAGMGTALDNGAPSTLARAALSVGGKLAIEEIKDGAVDKEDASDEKDEAASNEDKNSNDTDL